MLATIVAPASAATSKGSCTGGKILHGDYGLLVSGSSLTPGSGYGKYLSGSLHFDGKCNITANNVNGGIDGVVSNAAATGTYLPGSGNTVAITLAIAGQSAPQTYTVGVTAGFPNSSTASAYGLETDGTAVATITLKPQLESFKHHATALLNGTYQLACRGMSDTDSDLNTMTFDGAGNVTGLDVFNNYGSQGSGAITGTYQVESDGTFSAVLTNNFAGFTLTGVISGFGSQIDYTYAYAGQGIVSCSGSM